MSLKKAFNNLIVKIINKISQGSVSEINDGITSCEEIKALCREATAEECVLLKDNGVLPLADKKFALFGRCQINTFYVGYGSGGDVKPPYRVSILDGLDKGGANLDKKDDEKLYKKYADRARTGYRRLVQTKKYSYDTDRQAKLVRPLYMNLLTGEQREFAQKRLLKALDNYGWRLGTDNTVPSAVSL